MDDQNNVKSKKPKPTSAKKEKPKSKSAVPKFTKSNVAKPVKLTDKKPTTSNNLGAELANDIIASEIKKLAKHNQTNTTTHPNSTNSNKKNPRPMKAAADPLNAKKEPLKKPSLPIIMAKFKLVMPKQKQNISFINNLDLNAIMNAITKEDSQILLVLKKEKITNYQSITLDKLYQTAVYCQIQNQTESASDGGSVKELFITGIKRVLISKIEYRNNICYAEYSLLNDIHPANRENAIKIIHKIAELITQTFSRKIQLPAEIMNTDMDIKNTDIENFVYATAYCFSSTPAELQKIFSENYFEKRLLLILNLLKLRIAEIKINKLIEEKINQSISKTQREFYLREKIKVIREQLGDTVDKKSDSDKIRASIKERDIPKSVKEKIFSELDKYEDASPFSSENSVIKAYIDWLVSLPWDRQSVVKINLAKAFEHLNESHYGLDKPKQRIVEELAVQLKTKDNNRGAIICFIGPPGVGKTSLARSIAKVTNRKFVKISLGGIKDESEIRGHRRTYVGAMPGRIIQSLKKVNVRNPLILLDEIDKMASDMRGDPASAMLEVLDPEQNKFFSDNYIEENFDLSEVMFVATANNISEISSALRDRLEIIHLHSYTEHEKFEIASRFLIPKSLKKTGLRKHNLKISKKMIMNIIFNYTMESGVRQLEREIENICRKIVVQAIVKKEDNYAATITTKNLDKYLGIIKYDYTKKSKKSLPGSVTGLAWTQYGGDILPIEVSMSAGSGKLNITGNLGDVMKESVQIALSFIKSNTQKFKIRDKLFEDFDIHLHVPEGAIPKDGPSAGITITSALLSLFKNRAISSSIAMTGEITLLGNILEIGGLKEKLISASRSRLKTIFVPRSNIKDLQEIPQETLKNLTIYPVDNYLEIYRHLFPSLTNKKPFRLQELVTTNFFSPNIFTNINIDNM